MSPIVMAALLIVGFIASAAVLALRKKPAPVAAARPAVVRRPVQVARRPDPRLARQRRYYQRRIREMQRQQLTLVYLLWVQAQQRPARPAAVPAQKMEAARA